MKKLSIILASLMLTTAFAGNSKFIKPHFEIGMGISYKWPTLSRGTINVINIKATPAAIWDLKINDKFNLNLGVKGVIVGNYHRYDLAFVETFYSHEISNNHPEKGGYIKLAPAVTADLEIKTKNPKYKGYIGLDYGMGVDFYILPKSNKNIAAPILFSETGNLHGGVKINDKYKVGAYLGTEGIGLEAKVEIK